MTTTTTSLKAGVFGAGVFGGHHARKYAASDRAELIGVYDINRERAEALAGALGVKAFDNAGALAEACEALTIANPAIAHYETAKLALEAGCHVLCEKPLADTAMRGRELIALAEAKERVLQVGHQERFVFRAMGLFEIEEVPQRVTARRMGLPSTRNLDVSVTVDLMIHDLDLAIALAHAPLDRVDAEARIVRNDSADVAHAVLSFANGYVAELTSSRVAEALDRVMRIEYRSGVLEIDFVKKTFSNTTGFPLDPDFGETPEAKDSLGANVNAFLASVLDGAPVAVPAEAGLAALQVARDIDRLAVA